MSKLLLFVIVIQYYTLCLTNNNRIMSDARIKTHNI